MYIYTYIHTTLINTRARVLFSIIDKQQHPATYTRPQPSSIWSRTIISLMRMAMTLTKRRISLFTGQLKCVTRSEDKNDCARHKQETNMAA